MDGRVELVTGGEGRSLVAKAAIGVGEAIITADESLCCVPAFAQPPPRPTACCCCLRFLCSDAVSQVQELAGWRPSAPRQCAEHCLARTNVSWLLAADAMASLLSTSAAKRIGPELVSEAVACMERWPPRALEAPPLAHFHRAAFEERGAEGASARDARAVDGCYRALEARWASVTGAELAWSLEAFSELLGLLAMNAIEVKIPHPFVFELNELVLSGAGADAKARLERLAPHLEALAKSCERGSATRDDADEEEDDDEVVLFAVPCRGRELSITSAMLPASVGVGLFPTVAVLNHSCEPSCTVVYAHAPDSHASVITAEEIEPGEELTISYVDVRLGVNERRAALSGRYGFVCDCRRCVAEKRQADRRAKGPARVSMGMSAGASGSRAAGRKSARQPAHGRAAETARKRRR
jgi:hypothetical protein